MTYFIIENNTQQGPFTLEQLAERHLTSETLVWAEGMANWTPAWQVEELRPIISGAYPQSVTPPPYSSGPDGANTLSDDPEDGERIHADATSSESRSEFQQAQGRTPEKRSHTSWLIGIIALLVILLLMVFTNPAKEVHENAIRHEVTEAINNISATQGNDIFEQGLNMISRIINQNIFDEALEQMLHYHNYGIFSTCTVGFDGRPHKVSFGFLGHVWTMNSDDIEKAIGGSAFVRNADGSQADADAGSRQGDRDDWDQQEDQTLSPDTANADATNDIGEYVKQQTDKTLQHVGAKVKAAIKDKVKQSSDSTSGNSISHLIDELLDLIGL